MFDFLEYLFEKAVATAEEFLPLACLYLLFSGSFAFLATVLTEPAQKACEAQAECDLQTEEEIDDPAQSDEKQDLQNENTAEVSRAQSPAPAMPEAGWVDENLLEDPFFPAAQENPIVYEDSHVQIAHRSIYQEEGVEGVTYLAFTCENFGDQNLILYASPVYVNDQEVSLFTGIPTLVKPGEPTEVCFFFHNNLASIQSADEIYSISLQFQLLDEAYNCFEETDEIMVYQR